MGGTLGSLVHTTAPLSPAVTRASEFAGDHCMSKMRALTNLQTLRRESGCCRRVAVAAWSARAFDAVACGGGDVRESGCGATASLKGGTAIAGGGVEEELMAHKFGRFVGLGGSELLPLVRVGSAEVRLPIASLNEHVNHCGAIRRSRL